MIETSTCFSFKAIAMGLLWGLLALVWGSAWGADPEDFSGLTNPQFYEGMNEGFSGDPDAPAFIEIYDPWGPINQRIYLFNAYFDDYLLMPAVKGYRFVVPKIVRTGIQNFFSNLGEVPRFFNSLLQFKGKKAVTTAARLVYNSTFGLAGFIDAATSMDAPLQDEDFGQTLAFYGVGPGPYMVLPFFGPSSARDTAGLIGDALAFGQINALVSPISIGIPDRTVDTPVFVLNVLQARDSIPYRYGQMNSPFEYDIVRYLYVQSRKFKAAE